MNIRQGGLYRTICGAVVEFRVSQCHGIVVSEGCAKQPHYSCKLGVGSSWHDEGPHSGKWGTAEYIKDHHMHIVEEILP